MSKVNHEAALILEQPFIKVPHEQLRRNLRATQRLIERDFLALQREASELSKRSPTTQALEAMITRVETLKKKLAESSKREATIQSSLRKRLTHLAEFESIHTTDSPAYAAWSDTRLDRWLVDWALRGGRPLTARAIAKSKEIEDLVDLELFAAIQRIEDALRRRSCAEALAWCNLNKMALAKLKNPFELDLRLQEFIELTRSNQRKEAMSYAQKHLTPFFATHAKQVTRCMGLLASDPSTTLARYQKLYAPSRWTDLRLSFTRTIQDLYSLPYSPFLHPLLASGLPSLKLPACLSHNSVDCPTCDAEGLGVLAKNVPWSHHVNSTIVCRLSGRIMDSDNPPLAFPGVGQVYSTEALKEMAERGNGRVVDPVSGVECAFWELLKVFIT